MASRNGQRRLLPEILDAVAERFHVLGAPSRLRILDALMDGPRGMGDLAVEADLTQSNLSRHVSELETAGCVRRVRDGRAVSVELADESLRELCALVCSSLESRARADHDRFEGV